MSTELYSNTPLAGENSIRILSIASANSLQDAIVGTLSAVSLSEKPEYQALSYTWGPPFEGQTLEDEKITINDQVLLVTGNLSNALKRLREAGMANRLWIDAICIDQKSEKEKSQQVVMMAEIYRSASDVLVWLGEESEERDGEFVLGLMPALLSNRMWSSDGWTDLAGPPSSRRLRKNSKAEDPSESRKLDNQQLGVTTAVIDEKFEAFASRRYFKRRW